jgi:hypothetical protein
MMYLFSKDPTPDLYNTYTMYNTNRSDRIGNLQRSFLFSDRVAVLCSNTVRYLLLLHSLHYTIYDCH